MSNFPRDLMSPVQDKEQGNDLSIPNDDSTGLNIPSDASTEPIPFVHDTEKDTPTLTTSAQVRPEGGVRAWLCVLGAFFGLFGGFGFLYAIGIFQTTYQALILSSYTPSTIAWIFAVQLALIWGPGPFVGRIIDTYGPLIVLIPSSILCVFALCMTSLSTQYYQVFLAQGLAFGMGAGGIFTACVVCVGQWFVTKNRGLAIGVATAGSSLGGVIFPLFFIPVMERVGFYAAVRYTALFVGILLFLCCILVQQRFPRKKWNHNVTWFDLTLFKDAPFALYTVGAFLVMLGAWGPLDFIADMGKTAGFSPNMSQYLISIICATSLPGRILIPHLGDKIGHFTVLSVSALVTGLSTLCLWLPLSLSIHVSKPGIIVFCCIYGFAFGAYVTELMPCVGKTGSVESLGQRFGTLQMVLAVSNVFGLPIMGAILSTQGQGGSTPADYLGLQLFSSLTVLAGTVFTITATYLLAKQRGTWRI